MQKIVVGPPAHHPSAVHEENDRFRVERRANKKNIFDLIDKVSKLKSTNVSTVASQIEVIEF